MGKRGGIKKAPNLAPAFRNPISLREESTGRKQTKGGSNSSKSMLKVEYLQKLAIWASGEAAIPSLGAFFGQHLATLLEAMGVPPDPSLFSCERCETILQPGFNCTVRIEKNRGKATRRRKKTYSPTQNNVVFKCHFCSYWNMKRGTPKGHMKEICPSKAKTSSKSEPAKPRLQKCASLENGSRSKDNTNETNELASPAFAKKIPASDSPVTPLVRTETSLLEGKSGKRNQSTSKRPGGTESNSTPTDVEKAVGTSSKRKRKSWTSLKEIAESSGHDSHRTIPNLTIPFCL